MQFNQETITGFLRGALDAGFDVHAMLNQVTEIRTGEAKVTQRNKEWETNGKYLFAIKTQDECLDPEAWRVGLCISFVREEFWKQSRHIEDTYLRGKIYLPEGFGEAMRGTFDYEGPDESKGTVEKLLTLAGFHHSVDLECWIKDHDP